jgi:hypothetical protein
MASIGLPVSKTSTSSCNVGVSAVGALMRFDGALFVSLMCWQLQIHDHWYLPSSLFIPFGFGLHDTSTTLQKFIALCELIRPWVDIFSKKGCWASSN